MKLATKYNDSITTLGIVLENTYLDAASNESYLNYHGSMRQWENSVDELERAEWWYDQWITIFPGVVSCPHGMGLQQCVDPVNHYDTRY